MSRYLVLFLAFNIQAFASVTYAANDLDKWNSEQGRVVRSALKDKLSTTTYTEKYPLHTDSIYKASENGGKVLTKLETSAEIKGSRVGSTIEALEKVDKNAAAKKFAQQMFNKWGKDLIKTGAAGVLVTVALDEMLDGIGWIMDEGGKVKYSPDNPKSPPLDKNTSPYLYQSSDKDGNLVTVYDINAHCSSLKYDDYNNGVRNYSWVFDSSSTAYPSTSCIYKRYIDGSYAPPNSGRPFQRYANPDYKGSSVESPSPSQSDMQSDIQDYFNDPKSPASKDLLIEQALKPKGKASIMWSDDPSSEQTIFSDHKNTAEKILNSDNPQGDGLTKTTPVITDGTTTETETNTDTTTNTDVNETTTTNPDGSTTTTGSNTSTGSSTTTTTSKWPPFCDYAAKLCDWLDWTKEMPEDPSEEEKPEINDKGIFNRTFDAVFSLSGECPPDYPIVFKTRYLAGTYMIDLKWLCISFTAIGYALIFLSNCIGLWILYETVTRKEVKW